MDSSSALETFGLAILVIIFIKACSLLSTGGIQALLAWVTSCVRSVPGVNLLLSTYIKNEVVGFVQQMCSTKDGHERSSLITIPEKGKSLLTTHS